MPLKKKHTIRNRLILLGIIAGIIALMLISFSAPEHITEVVLFP
jgi:hypothetical protein